MTDNIEKVRGELGQWVDGLPNPDTEALKRENERLRKALEIANETFTMLWDKVPPFELPFEKQIRDAGLAVEKALATTKRGGGE